MNPYKILVVDDEEDLCEILQFNLETEGYTVDVANSAEEALKKDLTAYNLLLLDVMMGEISGFRMARMLSDDPKTAAIPIIFLTAKDTENDRLTGFNIGADDYICKPYSPREVVARRAVERRRLAAIHHGEQRNARVGAKRGGDDLAGAVLRSVIGDDQLDRGIVAGQHPPHRGLDHPLLGFGLRVNC